MFLVLIHPIDHVFVVVCTCRETQIQKSDCLTDKVQSDFEMFFLLIQCWTLTYLNFSHFCCSGSAVPARTGHFPAAMLTCHCRKSTGGISDINYDFAALYINVPINHASVKVSQCVKYQNPKTGEAEIKSDMIRRHVGKAQLLFVTMMPRLY